ncbi:MAG: Tetratricopeptide repeat protein [Planctomycetaceae bacterium]|nr:Tetratricopeptide repeat protein [Planctomycetaceae bacterium]
MARFSKLELGGDSPDNSKPDPTSRSEQKGSLEQAIEQRRCGHYENALRLYSRALEEDKSLVTGWLGQVQMLIMLDESVEAELWSRKALELFPANGDLLAGRAQAYRRIGDKGQALLLSDGAMKAAGQSAYRWMVRGELMIVIGQDTHLHCFDKAMQIDTDWLVPLEIARIYQELGNPSRALGRICRAVELAPDQYYAWFVRGEVERDLGLEKAAIKSWQHCLELCHHHADAERELSRLEVGGWSLTRIWRRWFGNR